MEITDFNFLKDEPAVKDQPGFFKFYHENFGPALKDIIENDSCVHTIGLFGRWGTGKSTIIDLLKSESVLKLFVFDAWKYQEDSLRRIFLIKLVEFLEANNIKIDQRVLDPLYKSSETTKTENVVDSSKLIFWRRVWMFVKQYWLWLIVALLLLGWMALNHYAKDGTFWAEVRDATKQLFSVLAAISILKPVAEKVLDESMGKIFSSVLPWSEVRTVVEKEDRLNSPEQFEKLFNAVLEQVPDRLVIVFDNIDRVQGDTAIKILSTIKTFLDPIKKSKVIFIVPCDAEAIEHQIRTFYGKNATEIETFDSSEYLRKLFNVVVFTPEFIDADLEAYAKAQLGKTGGIRDLLLDEDVVLVITRAFSRNPREIKQFINNLISTVLVASKTEVNDLIVKPGKIAYLAKVLVLKQKFPAAYERLKEKWYEPNNILKDSDEPELINFLNGTSRITTDDAEPYIYFKRPSFAANLNDSLLLRQHLLAGDEKQFMVAQGAEANLDAVIEYILMLLRRYQSQHDPLFNIFTTQLAVIANTATNITKKDYYDQCAAILDNQLWQDYLKLDTNVLFKFLLNSSLLDSRIRSKVIDRYVLSLSNDQLKQPENRAFVLTILKNFITFPLLTTQHQKQQIAAAIEQGFSADPSVIETFTTTDDQSIYVTSKSFQQFIKGVNRSTVEKVVPIILKYKSYILQAHLVETVLNKITEWVNAETAESPDYRPQKDSFMQAMGKLLETFRENIKTDLSPENRQQFGQAFIQAFNNIGDWSNRWILVNLLRRLWLRLDDSQKNECSSLIDQFFQNASADKIKAVLSYWDKDFASTFLGEHFTIIQPRTASDNKVLSVIYEFSNKDQRVKITDYLIQNKENQGLDFIVTLNDDLPDRQLVIKQLLIKASSLAPAQRVTIYQYINNKLAKTDGDDIKDAAVSQIKELLKSEDPSVQKIGYDFLTTTNFLSVDRKREIGKNVLEHLRQAGKVLTEAHAFSLKSVFSLHATLQETPKRDYVYLLFNSIKPDRSRQAIEVFLDLLKNLSPQFSEHQKDYEDLYSELKKWPDESVKNFIIENVLQLRPKSPTKDEKSYWTLIEGLTPKVEESTPVKETGV